MTRRAESQAVEKNLSATVTEAVSTLTTPVNSKVESLIVVELLLQERRTFRMTSTEIKYS